MTQRQHDRGWDTRAWLVSLLGGTASVTCLVVSLSPRVGTRLNAVVPNSSDWLDIVFAVLSVLLLPAVLSGIARRWTFFWGIIPLFLFLAAVCIKVELDHRWNSFSSAFWPILLVLGCAWVISSGPVSLIRWLRVRAARRHAALLASYQAQRGAASGPQEGVWPPPPEYQE